MSLQINRRRRALSASVAVLELLFCLDSESEISYQCLRLWYSFFFWRAIHSNPIFYFVNYYDIDVTTTATARNDDDGQCRLVGHRHLTTSIGLLR